ncbi:MAG TPA: hypothetical protein VFW52_03790 [Candidatus Saccharimonadales bacterium]|nr:hypothetical protein [Candidatus Saccharimonadales bacterium]
MSPKNRQEASVKRPERFSPRYFRNIGATLLIGWVSINGAVKLAAPEDRQSILNFNPLTLPTNIAAYFDNNGCSAESRAFGPAMAEPKIELANSAAYKKELGPASSPSQAIGLLSEFTDKNYGFKTSSKLNALNLNPAAAQQFNAGIIGVFEQFSAMPNELVNLANISGLSISEESDRLGDADNFDGAINLSLSALIDGSEKRVLAHEIGHLLDDKECGVRGKNRDKTFESLNSPGFKYGTSDQNEQKRNLASFYAGASPAEDKAEIYSFLLTGAVSYESLRSFPEPVIKQKFELLLSRLENRLPGISNFLLSQRGV